MRRRTVATGALWATTVIAANVGLLVGYDAIHSHHTATAVATTVPSCVGDVVSVWRDDPTPCDVTSQRIDVYGDSLAECDHAGGEYILTNPDDTVVPATYICEGVDN